MATYTPPVDSADRRRRVYRWKKSNPGKPVRGVALHPDGTRVMFDELAAWGIERRRAAIQANVSATNRLFTWAGAMTMRRNSLSA